MIERADPWPVLAYEDLAPTVEHLHRLVQIAGKYTLDQAFEPGWGNVVLGVTPRGLGTPTLRCGGVTFTVHYRLLDGDVVIEADTGVRTIPLQRQCVADFYAAFVSSAAELGVSAPGSAIATEIAGAVALDVDREVRTWDPAAARLIWIAFNSAADALEQWQASYRGHRPRVGVMWGGFDLSATRYRAAAVTPPPDRPAFMQYGMTEEYVAVGFSFGSPDSPAARSTPTSRRNPTGSRGGPGDRSAPPGFPMPVWWSCPGRSSASSPSPMRRSWRLPTPSTAPPSHVPVDPPSWSDPVTTGGTRAGCRRRRRSAGGARRETPRSTGQLRWRSQSEGTAPAGPGVG